MTFSILFEGFVPTVPFGKIRHFQADGRWTTNWNRRDESASIGRCPPPLNSGDLTSRGAIKCKSLDDSKHDAPINHGGFIRFTHRFFSNLFPRLGNCTPRRTEASNAIPPIGPKINP